MPLMSPREYEESLSRLSILRLIENMTLGTAAVGYLTESMHGAGSPQAQRIMIARQVDMEAKRRSAQRLCGVGYHHGDGLSCTDCTDRDRG